MAFSHSSYSAGAVQPSLHLRVYCAPAATKALLRRIVRADPAP